MISINNLEKSFPVDKISSNKVLDKLNLHIDAGDRVALIGESRTGKTTLLKCIAGLVDYDDGNIIYGRQINLKNKAHESFKQKIGFVFQNYGLFPNKTVLENVIFPLTYVRKVAKKDAIEIAQKTLKELGILDKANEYPNHLSGGQKQRVAIARALVIQPLILLFDEPTSALDPKMIKELEDIINKIDPSITMIIVSHSIEFVSNVCNKGAILKDGKIVRYDSIDKIVKEFVSKK